VAADLLDGTEYTKEEGVVEGLVDDFFGADAADGGCDGGLGWGGAGVWKVSGEFDAEGGAVGVEIPPWGDGAEVVGNLGGERDGLRLPGWCWGVVAGGADLGGWD
jgi:hypothetical protein